MDEIKKENLDETEWDRKTCCEVLGLPENSSDDTVKARYGALLRQYKRKTDEYGTTYEDLDYYHRITKAYDTVFGIEHDCGDTNPTSPIPYKIRRKFSKFAAWMEQYCLLVILGCVVVFLGIMFVIQRKNTGKPDLIVKFVGAYSESAGGKLKDGMNEKSRVFDNAQITFFTVTTQSTILDRKARTEAEAFLGALMADGALDVVLIDRESFDVYAAKGYFLPLDGYVENYEETAGKTPDVCRVDGGEAEGGKTPAASGIYGVDVTDTSFFAELPLNWLYDEEAGQAKSMIFAVAARSSRPDACWDFCLELLG